MTRDRLELLAGWSDPALPLNYVKCPTRFPFAKARVR